MKLINFLILAAMTLSFVCSCSGNEDPDDSGKKGAETAERLRNVFCDGNGEIRLIAAEDAADRYITPVENAEEATEMCLALIGDESWDIADGTYRLADNYGSVAVRHSESEGVFLSMAFNVREIPSFTLDICSHEYFDSHSNMPQYPGWGKGFQEVCPYCGKTYIVGTTCTCGGKAPIYIDPSSEPNRPGKEYAEICYNKVFGPKSKYWLVPMKDSKNEYMTIQTGLFGANQASCSLNFVTGTWRDNDTATLPDDYGTIIRSLRPESDILWSMVYNIKTIEPFKIYIVTQNWFDAHCDFTKYPEWKDATLRQCESCGIMSIGNEATCPLCDKAF